MSLAPHLERHEQDQETLWAAVDYGIISQSAKVAISSVSSDNGSPDQIDVTSTNREDDDLSGYSEYGFIPVPYDHQVEDNSYHNLTLDGMSPLAAFFGGGSTIGTFGG